jgi:FdhD protein
VPAVEQPLEIRLGTLSYTVTMGTPGDDFDLISLFPCFLVSEGIIWNQGQLVP